MDELKRQLAALPDPLQHDFAAVERQAIADALELYAEKMREGYRLTARESYRREEDCARTLRLAILYPESGMVRISVAVQRRDGNPAGWFVSVPEDLLPDFIRDRGRS